jgi:hypothetical protein
MTSPYLMRPLRSLEQALRDLGKQSVDDVEMAKATTKPDGEKRSQPTPPNKTGA